MRETDISARDMIHRIAQVADAVAAQAGVGGMEMAGAIVSHLDKHPENIEPFLNGGFLELPHLLHRHGNLSWRAQNGQIVNRETVTRAEQIKRLGALGDQLGEKP